MRETGIRCYCDLLAIATEKSNIQKVAIAAYTHQTALFLVPHVLVCIVFLQHSSSCTRISFTHTSQYMLCKILKLNSQKQEVDRRKEILSAKTNNSMKA